MRPAASDNNQMWKWKNETKPKKPQNRCRRCVFIFIFGKFSRDCFHFWRQRWFISGLLIAGDCNHFAASDRIGPLLLWGWRCKRMSRLELKAAICHSRALRLREGDSFMGMNLWTFHSRRKKQVKARTSTHDRIRCRLSGLFNSSSLLEMVNILQL